MPKITIITICFNNLDELKATCQSVDSQIEKPDEHWIIDGSKNEQIKNYLSNTIQPIYRKWICEPDHGIADAFNKGVALATGDFIQFLNSGDLLYNENVMYVVKKTLSESVNAKWIHGQLQMKRGGKKVLIGKPFDQTKVYRGMRATFHPTMFVHKSLFEKYGNFNDGLKIAMDYDFLVRIRKEPFIFMNEPIAIFDDTGVSNNNYIESLKESKLVYEKHCGKNIKLTLWQWRLKLLHYLLQSSLGKWLYNVKKKMGMENI